MPRRDGSGPAGTGSMTGRRLGTCLALGIPLVAGAVAAFGRGGGFGFGRCLGRGNGWRNMVGTIPAPTSDDELSVLKNQAEILENNLKGIKESISNLEQKQEEE